MQGGRLQGSEPLPLIKDLANWHVWCNRGQVRWTLRALPRLTSIAPPMTSNRSPLHFLNTPLLVAALTGSCLLFTAGCRDRDASTVGDQASADRETLTPTRGGTGAGADPETQGGSGMFEAETRSGPVTPEENLYVTGIGNERQEQIPTEKGDGTAFGQEHESRYTDAADTAQSDRTVIEGTDLEQRVREELRNGSSTLALSDEQLEQIEVTVESTTVRLTGQVPDQAAAERVGRHVAGISGVREVENQLQPAEAGALAE